MKEQDYMNIMGAIRGEYLEEAVSWDGSERRRIRQIRRMTVSFGAVAAALAVVIGMIAYKANKDRIEIANSVPESSIVSTPDESSQVPVIEQETNLFGGHGELRRVKDARGDIFYDDEYVYMGTNKVSLLQSGKYIPMDDSEIPKGLMSDGKTLFRLHDGKLFETDSYGNETELMNLADYQLPNAGENAQILSAKKISSRMLVILYGQPDWSAAEYLVVDLQNKQVLKMKQGLSGLTEISETSFYALDYTDGSLYRISLNNGELLEENVLGPIYQQEDTPVGVESAKLDGKQLYMIVRDETYSGGEPAARHVVRDLATGKMAETEFPQNQNAYLGSALIRTGVEDGRLAAYRSNPDLSNEMRILYLPFADYIDTQTYGTPDLRLGGMLFESAELVILNLPVTDSEGRQIPTLHGEEEVIIDLRTGKTVFTGRNYDDGTEPEAVTAAPVTVTAAATTGTTALTTETSAVTTAVTTESMTEEQRKSLAMELIYAYCNAYESYALGCSNDLDPNDVRKDGNGNIQYCRVTIFNSIAEVRQAIAKAAAGDAYDQMIAMMEDIEPMPIYREFDGKLYSSVMGKGAEFQEWLWDTMTIESVSENSFEVTVKEESYAGMINIHHFTFTDLQDGTKNSWRVSSRITDYTEKTLSGEPVSLS